MPDAPAPPDHDPPDGTARPPQSSRGHKPEAEATPDFTMVFAHEVDVVAERRKVVGLDAHALRNAAAAPGGAQPAARLGLTGLGLSGGGIRSASFSLGVLQAFERAQWNHHFDYLSTVSGGGFTGSTLTSALHYARLDGEPFAFSKSASSDAAIVTHLRNQSSYLTPGGFLDTVRLPAMVVRGFALNVLALLPWLFIGALVTEFYYALAYNNPNAFRYIVDFVPMLMGGIPFALLMLASPLVVRPERRAARWRDLYERAFAASLVLLVIGVSSHFVLLLVNHSIEHPKETKRLLANATTYWLALFGVLVVTYQIVAAKNATRARIIRRVLLAGTGMLVPLALFSAYVVFSIHLTPVPYYQDTPAGVSVELIDELQALATAKPPGGETSELPVGVRRWLEQQGLDPEQGRLELAPPRSATEAVTLAETDGAGRGCIDIVQDCSQLERCDTCDFVATGCCWTFSDDKSGVKLELSLWGHGETSLHAAPGQVSLSLHRIPWSSLAIPKLAMRSDWVNEFVGRLHAAQEGEMWIRYPLDRECWLVSIALGLSLLAFLVGLVTDANGLSLHGFYRDRLARAFVVRGGASAADPLDTASRLLLSDLAPDRSGAPYPLINATLNVSGGIESALRFRRGSSFVFSPLFIGSQATGYVATRTMEAADPEFTLASATAISAAAAGPNMGSFTSGSLAPLFALLNLRLGYWLRHPQRAARKWLLLRKPGNRHILREALGLIDDRGAFVNLSDGGHFENLGAYELLRRKCRLIIIVDSEEDRLGQLKGLTTLMRLARIDFGAMITADLSAFGSQPGAQPWLWATIHYGTLPDGTEEIGHLLYVKANMVAGAPHYVDAYRKQSPDFPHESTADQFFNEVQFECYRALGYHLGTMVTKDKELRDRIAELLASNQVAVAPSLATAAPPPAQNLDIL